MPPVRRYLRISAYSVLEVRIYLDNPADVHRWLLNPSDPALPRVISAIRPLVLPKLREENERARNKGSKKKGVKDVVVEEEFDVSIFLTELSSRHALLVRHKEFTDKGRRLESNSDKLTGTRDAPLEVGEEDDGAPAVLREESSEEQKVDLSALPVAVDEDGDGEPQVIDSDEDDDSGGAAFRSSRRERRRPTADGEGESHDGSRDEENVDDKKKLALKSTYDGFRIYGRILCLVVKRKSKGPRERRLPMASGGGHNMMEEWISTQAQDKVTMDDD